MALSYTSIRADIAQAVFEGLSNKNNLFIGTEVMPISHRTLGLVLI